MGEVSEIEWTDSTWTPIRARRRVPGGILVGWHCEHVSPGCANCYAERQFNLRMGTKLEYKPGHRSDIEIFLDENMLLAPLKWKKPRRIFVCSMTDLFADFVKDEWIDRMFAVMALCPQHRFQVLTKRAERMQEYCSTSGMDRLIGAIATEVLTAGRINRERAYELHHSTGVWPNTNVWLGISAEDQERWDERKEYLRNTPAAVRFASFEPLLGPIVDDDFSATIQWAIVGGESGPHARPMHPDWARSIRDQCTAAGVAFFMKQWGEWGLGDTIPIAQNARDCPAGTLEDNRDGKLFYAGHGRSMTLMHRVGKKRAGRLLDGREWNEMPG